MARRRFGGRGELKKGDERYVLAMVNKGKRMSRCGVVFDGDDHDLTVITEHGRKQTEGELAVMDWFNPETKRVEKRTPTRGQGRWGNTSGTQFFSVVNPNIDVTTLRQCGNDNCAKIILAEDLLWHDQLGGENLTFLGLAEVTETLSDAEGGEYEETHETCPYCGSTDLPTLGEVDAYYHNYCMNEHGRHFMTEKERARWDKEWDKIQSQK